MTEGFGNMKTPGWNWTEQQRERLAAHFEKRLETIGIDWGPKDIPGAKGIEIISVEDQPEYMEDVWAHVRVQLIPVIPATDLTALQPGDRVEFFCVNFREVLVIAARFNYASAEKAG